MHKHIRTSVQISFVALATLFTNAFAFAQGAGIDPWEPPLVGNAIPTVDTLSDRTTSGWVGASDGSVWFSFDARVAAPTWYRMDLTSNGGRDIDMHFTKSITSIASADSHDEYVAYVGINSDPDLSPLYVVMWGTGGINWLKLFDFQGFLGVSVNVLDRARLYVATSSGVSYSTDFGHNWQNTQPAGDSLVPPGSTCSIRSVDPSNQLSYDRIMVSCTNGDIWIVTGARTQVPVWKKLRTDFTGVALVSGQAVSRVQIDNRDANGNTYLTVQAGASSDAVRITRDGGLSWQPVPAPVFSGGTANMLTASFGLAPGAPTLYGQTATFGGVRSDDNGQTWFQSPRWSGRNLSVEYKHYDRDPNGNQLMPLFRVRNLGSVPVPLGGLSFSYLFTPEGSSAQTYWCDYSPYCQWNSSGCSTVVGTVTGGLLKVSIAASVSATLAPGQVSGEIQGRVAKANWTSYNQSNDFSFITGAYDWQTNRHIVLVDRASQWIWGTTVP